MHQERRWCQDRKFEIIDNLHHRYISAEYKDLIKNIFKYRLKNKNLFHTNFDNRIDLKYFVNRYLKKKNVHVFEDEFDF